MAVALGISAFAYQKYEQGKVPDAVTRVQIALKLGVSERELWPGVDGPGESGASSRGAPESARV